MIKICQEQRHQTEAETNDTQYGSYQDFFFAMINKYLHVL